MRQELLLRQLRRNVTPLARERRLATTRADRDQPLPLSWGQQRLWFLDRLDRAAGAAYHLPVALRLEGLLDELALRRALDRIVTRHEVLRTVFVEQESTPWQRIGPLDIGFALQTLDMRGLDEKARELEVARRADEEAATPFDLSHGPLIRGQLLRLTDNEHVLLLTQHHIVSDAWSSGVLIRELGALYGAFTRGEADPLPLLPVQYADYAVWQRGWLQGDALRVQLDFWKAHLTGAPTRLELPTDRPRPTVQNYRGDRVEIHITPELTEGLRRLAQAHGATLFMTLLAGWSTLLGRLSGQTDVVIGTSVANRQRAEIEPLVGFFANTLALRVQLDGAQTMSDLLPQVKVMALGAYAHQDMPFERVVEAVNPLRSLDHNPIFQVLLAFNNTPWNGDPHLSGLSVSPLELQDCTTHFDLSLSLEEKADALQGSLVYATALFDASTIKRHRDYLLRLLEAMVADPSQPLARIDLLAAAERELLLHTWNQTETPYPADRCIHQLFEEQVAQTPDAIALVQDDTQLTYAQLNAQANRLAHRLIAMGVRPDSRVAICVDRRPHMVVGLLAILKAGGAYVPLDPAYPVQRLRELLDDAQPVLLLTDAAGKQVLGTHSTANLPSLSLDELPSDTPDANPDPQALGLTSAHLAYVIYTSGSTGKPKGVMVEHRSLVNYVWWDIHAYYRQWQGGSPTVFSISFDAGVTTVFGALMSGQPLTLIPAGDEIETLGRGPGDRPAYCLVKMTPSHLKLVNQALRAGDNASPTRALMLGGEAMVPDDVAYWQQRFPGVRLVNHFGPTETTVGCATFEIVQDVSQWHSVPIGRPIANTRIYLLDGYGQPVPLGAVGEIFIGGAGVARGYLNRPELTAERFVQDPFCNEPGARMYRTGDLARYRPDGNLEFLGRADHQVKIRGFRIELGEIEARLSQHPAIREAVVLAREDVAGDQRLVAYVIAHSDSTIDTSDLRAHLARQLPDYMVPSAFVQLEALPLTPNGKLDRKALPAPQGDALARRPYEAPQGEVEQILADIWSELLGVEQISRHDDFFELGGHSLLAVQLIARLRMEGLNVAAHALFVNPILSELAQAARQFEEF